MEAWVSVVRVEKFLQSPDVISRCVFTTPPTIDPLGAVLLPIISEVARPKAYGVTRMESTDVTTVGMVASRGSNSSSRGFQGLHQGTSTHRSGYFNFPLSLSQCLDTYSKLLKFRIL